MEEKPINWEERIAAHRPQSESTGEAKNNVVSIDGSGLKSVSEAESKLNDLKARLADVNTMITRLQSDMMMEFTRADGQKMEELERRKNELQSEIRTLEDHRPDISKAA